MPMDYRELHKDLLYSFNQDMNYWSLPTLTAINFVIRNYVAGKNDRQAILTT